MHYRGSSSGGILGLPPAITYIILISGAMLLLQPLLGESVLYRTPAGRPIAGIPNGLALVPHQVVRGWIWELATYIFLHGGFMHFAFNMFGLVIFGSNLERYWGSRDFTKYYFVTGIGAGVIHVLATYAFGDATWIPTIGASGAIFGILVAYAMAFPNHQILLWFVIPVSARTLVIFYVVAEIFMIVQSPYGGNVARFAHLGGALVGYLYLKNETLLWRTRRWLGRIQATVESNRRSRIPDEDPETEERINRILEKISREGMGALTREEEELLKKRADRARARQQGRDR